MGRMHTHSVAEERSPVYECQQGRAHIEAQAGWIATTRTDPHVRGCAKRSHFKFLCALLTLALTYVDGAGATAIGPAHPARVPIDAIPPSFASMAYDACAHAVMLFGGVGPSNTTWVWAGQTWLPQSAPVSPPARLGAAMTYDAAHGVVLLFGGTARTGKVLGDTWTWDGHIWRRLSPMTSPTPRTGASMAYDAVTRTVMLFGGEGEGESGRQGVSTLFNDTWVWTGAIWRRLSTPRSPSSRANASIAYDARSRSIVLFAGGAGDQLNDTWTWNGRTWARQHPPLNPPARASASMTYDAARQRIVLFGGVNIIGLADTWTWDGTTWTRQRPATVPTPGQSPSAAYDADRHRVLLWTGDATWTWTGSTWRRLGAWRIPAPL